MIYYIPQTKTYVSSNQQFTIPSTKTVVDPETGDEVVVETQTTIPRRAIDLMYQDIEAVPQPEAGPDQVVEQGADGWIVRDLTQDELDARALAEADAADARVAQAIDRLWREAWDVWGEAQLAAVDRQTIFGWAGSGVLDAEGMQMVKDIVHWHDQVFTASYMPAKAAIQAAGDWVEPDWSTWPECPHDFYAVYAHRNDLA